MLSKPLQIQQSYLNRTLAFEPLFHEEPPLNLALSVVIPAYNEPEISKCLASLNDCIPVSKDVEVLLIINDSIDAAPDVKMRNKANLAALNLFDFSNPCLHFNMYYLEDLPVKKSGVGVARKVGMDEALRRFVKANIEDGIIICLDADCTVEDNYLQSIIQHFNDLPDKEAFSIHFEHDFKGETTGLCQLYELHLRYYIEAQRILRLPYAFQTVGSSMAVRSNAYAAEGGMPKKKAGEDFYFLHKFIKKGLCGEINDTTVFPSCRASDRVPFGTGKAIGSAILGTPLRTYPFEFFLFLKPLLELIPAFYETIDPIDLKDFKINNYVIEFFTSYNFSSKIEEIKKHTSSLDQFTKRFFRWFDAFLLMKYLHFMRDADFEDAEILPEAIKLMLHIEESNVNNDLDSILGWYRKRAKKGIQY